MSGDDRISYVDFMQTFRKEVWPTASKSVQPPNDDTRWGYDLSEKLYRKMAADQNFMNRLICEALETPSLSNLRPLFCRYVVFKFFERRSITYLRSALLLDISQDEVLDYFPVADARAVFGHGVVEELLQKTLFEKPKATLKDLTIACAFYNAKHADERRMILIADFAKPSDDRFYIHFFKKRDLGRVLSAAFDPPESESLERKPGRKRTRMSSVESLKMSPRLKFARLESAANHARQTKPLPTPKSSLDYFDTLNAVVNKAVKEATKSPKKAANGRKNGQPKEKEKHATNEEESSSLDSSSNCSSDLGSVEGYVESENHARCIDDNLEICEQQEIKTTVPVADDDDDDDDEDNNDSDLSSDEEVGEEIPDIPEFELQCAIRFAKDVADPCAVYACAFACTDEDPNRIGRVIALLTKEKARITSTPSPLLSDTNKKMLRMEQDLASAKQCVSTISDKLKYLMGYFVPKTWKYSPEQIRAMKTEELATLNLPEFGRLCESEFGKLMDDRRKAVQMKYEAVIAKLKATCIRGFKSNISIGDQLSESMSVSEFEQVVSAALNNSSTSEEEAYGKGESASSTPSSSNLKLEAKLEWQPSQSSSTSSSPTPSKVAASNNTPIVVASVTTLKAAIDNNMPKTTSDNNIPKDTSDNTTKAVVSEMSNITASSPMVNRNSAVGEQKITQAAAVSVTSTPPVVTKISVGQNTPNVSVGENTPKVIVADKAKVAPKMFTVMTSSSQGTIPKIVCSKPFEMPIKSTLVYKTVVGSKVVSISTPTFPPLNETEDSKKIVFESYPKSAERL